MYYLSESYNTEMGEGLKGMGVLLPLRNFSTSKMAWTQNGAII